MNILLGTPYLSANWFDSGLLWLHALSQLGHSVIMWDHRLEGPATAWLTKRIDVALMLKGLPQHVETFKGIAHVSQHPVKTISYWPDAFGRTPGLLQQLLDAYDLVATPVRPTPAGCLWLPTGWDWRIHSELPQVAKTHDSVFIGTATPRKYEYVRVVKPKLLFGNDWSEFGLYGVKPVYLHDYVRTLNMAKVAIHVHRDGDVGVGRRFFEFIACTFTLTDLAPGVEEVLGSDLAAKVGFTTPEEAKEKLRWYLNHPGELQATWKAEKMAIQPYGYEKAANGLLNRIGKVR